MVNIDSFEFIDAGNSIKVTVSVPTSEDVHYWDNVQITDIIIGTQNAYDTQSGDFTTDQSKLNTYTNKGEQDSVVIADDGKSAYATLHIDGGSIRITDLFFVKVTDNGEFPLDAPCQISGVYTWSSTYNRFTMDVKGMNYLTELTRNCETPDGFINYILNRQALDVAADCGDYTAMIARYNDMNGQSSTSSSSSRRGCGCL